MSIYAAQLQSFIIAGSGSVIGDTTMTFTQMLDIKGIPLTMASLGTVCYMTVEPNTVNEEQIQFTGLTQNSNGTATITGVSNVGFLTPYTVTTGFLTTHAGSSTAIITNTSAFYNGFANVFNPETITGLWTFTTSPIVPTPTTATQAASKSYVDGVAIAGAPDSSTTVKGIGKVSVAPVSSTNPIFVGQNDPVVPTQGENDALVGNNTSIAVGTGNKFVTQTGFQNRAETYATSSGSANAYVLTLSPVPTAYAAGQEFEFKANFSNTTTATLNVNSLGAKTINKLDGATALISGDIINGQVVKVKYDGTNFQMISPIGTATSFGLFKSGTTTHTMNSSTTQVIPHGLGVIPKYIRITVIPENGAANNFTYQSIGVYNGTTTSTVFMTQLSATSKNGSGIDATNIIALWTDTAIGTGTTAVGTYDATNITLTYTLTGGGYSNQLAAILWEAQA